VTAVNAYAAGAVAQATRPPGSNHVWKLNPAALGIDGERISVGNVELVPAEHQLFIDGQRVHISVRECELLHALMVGAGHVIARGRLYEQVWGKPMPHRRDRTIDGHIRRLRVRLADAAPNWVYIHTHFGHGYRFEPETAPQGKGDQ
jgi:DNA-binding response OmpR family regulator